MKKFSLLLIVLAMSWEGTLAQAAVPPLTIQPNFSAQNERLLTKPAALEGIIDLTINQGVITTPTQESFLTNKTQTVLKQGELFTLPQGGRGRLKFSNGSFILLGEKTQLQFVIKNNKIEINLYSGKIIAYNVSGLKNNIALTVHVKEGQVSLLAGKIGVSLAEQGHLEQIAVFSENAMWTDNQNQHVTLVANSTLNPSDAMHFNVGLLSQNEAQKWLVEASPEPLLVLAAMKKYIDRKSKEARALFEEVQRAFPYNTLTMYYLGLIALEEKRYGETIRQWQLYSKIDPTGAQEKEIPKQLTLLLNQQLQDEIKLALATEAKLGDVKPEPNSVAVQAITLRGDAKYQMISKGLTAMIITDLTKVPGLKVLERQKLQKLLDEIKLSESGLVDKKTMVRSGKLLRAEKFVFGDFEVKPENVKAASQPDQK